MPETSKSRSFMDYIKSADLFGVPIQLHVHKETNYKTFFGALLSFCVIFGLLGTACSMLYSALYHSNLNFLSSRALSRSSVLELDENKFVMALSMTDTAFTLDESYFMIDFVLVATTAPNSEITESLGATKCSKEYLQLHAQNFSGIDTENLLCPKRTDFSVKSKNAQYVQVSLKKCQNMTDSPIVCASQEELNDYFDDPKNIKPISTSLYFTNNLLDMLNDSPNVSYLKKLDLKLPGGNLGRQTDLYFVDQIVSVESSIFSYLKHSIDVENTFTFDEMINDQILYSADGSFMEINFKKSEYQREYSLSFTRVSDILAFIGGFAKALMIIGSAVALPYNQFYYNLAISNEIYQFDSRPKNFYQKTMKKAGKFARKFSKTFRNLDNFDLNKEPNQDEASGDQTPVNENQNRRLIQNEKVQKYHPFFESLLKRHHKLDYTIKELFKGLFFCCKKRNLRIKYDLYCQAEDRLKKDIDVITILKKLQDVDKLKQLLLNDEQLELFNYKRPLNIEYLGQLNRISQIPLVNKRKNQNQDSGGKEQLVPKRSFYLHDRTLDTAEQFKILFDAFQIISKDSSNPVNQKLTQMLGADLLKIFEKLDQDYQSEIAALDDRKSLLYGMDGKMNITDQPLFQSIDNATPVIKPRPIEESNDQGLPGDDDYQIDSDRTDVVHQSDKKNQSANVITLAALDRAKTLGPAYSDIEIGPQLTENSEVTVQAMKPKFPMKDSKNVERFSKLGMLGLDTSDLQTSKAAVSDTT